MANRESGTSQQLRIAATVNAEAGWVRLEPHLASIPPGREVVWTFRGVPGDQRPALRFVTFTPRDGGGTGLPEPSLGPFGQVVRRDSEIRASGGSAVAGEHSYKVCLVPVDDATAVVRQLSCRGVSAGGLVDDPGPARGGSS